MADPYHHSVSSVRRWGGQVDDYLPLHRWMDASKQILPDFRHRMLRHHSEGIEVACQIFGQAIEVHLDDGGTKMVPVRWVLEQHCHEDFGKVPAAVDWLRAIKPAPWMNRPLKLSRELEKEEQA